MEVSQAKEIVNAHVHHLRDQLRLWDWHIDIEYRHLADDVGADCTVRAAYQQAVIRIDNEKADTPEALLGMLRHELIHIFIWPMHSFGDWASEKSGGELPDEDFHTWTFYLERMVWNVEQLLDLHKVPLMTPAE